MATTPVRTSLKWDFLVTKRQGLNCDLLPGKEKWMWVPTSATLIYGERDAVLVDAFLTVEQAHAAVEWIAASGKNLPRSMSPTATAIISLASASSWIGFRMPKRLQRLTF